jgi:hypothetical protein
MVGGFTEAKKVQTESRRAAPNENDDHRCRQSGRSVPPGMKTKTCRLRGEALRSSRLWLTHEFEVCFDLFQGEAVMQRAVTVRDVSAGGPGAAHVAAADATHGRDFILLNSIFHGVPFQVCGLPERRR